METSDECIYYRLNIHENESVKAILRENPLASDVSLNLSETFKL